MGLYSDKVCRPGRLYPTYNNKTTTTTQKRKKEKKSLPPPTHPGP